MILGMDLSLTSPALVAFDRERNVFGPIHFVAPTADLAKRRDGWRLPKEIASLDRNTEAFRCARLEWLRVTICQTVAQVRPTHVAIEDYGFTGKGASLWLPELGGAVKNYLWRSGVPFRLYDPQALKLYLANRGDARKEEMIAAAASKVWVTSTGEYGKATGDIVDAMACVRLLADELTARENPASIPSMPEMTRKLLNRVTKSRPVNILADGFVVRGVTA